jgi:hypothetical protein|tara:strand:+ start:214 stop:624 length:411 start_codon:yes stop_codon:yes gene_type:complete
MPNTQNSSNINKNQLTRVAVKLFFAITDSWSLTDKQRCILAGIESRTTLRNWRMKLDTGDAIALSRDTLERLSYIAGIYKGIQLLFSQQSMWNEWVKKPNKHFAGQSVLDRMLAGNVSDLSDVRRYIDGWRGEHFG